MEFEPSTRLLGLPWLPGIKELASQVNLSESLLQRILRQPAAFYRVVAIPKRTGGTRELSCPAKPVKAVQAWILRSILERVRLDEAATAYIRRKTLLDNVEPHQRNQYVMCLDLQSFFDTITEPRVRGIFRALGYPENSAHMLSRMCTFRGRLPQGGVTSPYLSNITCMKMDRRIRRYVGLRNVTYTRYADDITLSAADPKNLFACIKLVREIIKDEGFQINEKKTRVLFPRHSRRITGLVIDQHKNRIGVGRSRRKYLRGRIHSLERGTLVKEDREKLTRHLEGWLAYMASVDRRGAISLTKYWEHLKAGAAFRMAAPASIDTLPEMEEPSRLRRRTRRAPRSDGS